MKRLNELFWRFNNAMSQWERSEGRIVVSARPQFLIIDPSSRCNARCVMCPQSFRASKGRGQDLPWPLFEKLGPILAGASQINLFGTGEPTLARDFPRLLEVTQRGSAPRAQLWTCTNGKHIPQQVLRHLRAPQMGLQFSVDGGTPEVFESIRRGVTLMISASASRRSTA